MAGRRSLTPLEERMLIAVTRKMTPRDGCLVTCQWMTGFRISEVLRITVGTVLKAGEIVPKIGLAPRQMKGGYSKTLWVPVVPELKRAIERQLSWLRLRYELKPDMPLFSRPASPERVETSNRCRATWPGISSKVRLRRPASRTMAV